MEYQESQLVYIPQGQIMREAREDLSGNWGMGVGVMLIVGIITSVTGLIPLIPLVISGPFTLGMVIWSQNISRDQSADVGNVFDGFQNFGTAIGAYLLILLAVTIGFIFFIIPGIILAVGLSQTMYIIADDPEIGPLEAMRESWELMDGYKWDYFVLNLRFLPWVLLTVLTLFIGMLWLAPWIQVTNAKFHDYLIQYDDEEDIESHLIDD